MSSRNHFSLRLHLYQCDKKPLGGTCIVKSCDETKDPLRTVSNAQSFHFYTNIGDYSGVSANSLEEFVNALQYVCSEAIIFHFARGDFQKWLRDVIGDNELAQKIDDIRKCERHLAAESCRKELLEAVRVHLLHLELAKYKSCSG